MLATVSRGILWERRCSCCQNVPDLWRQPARRLASKRCQQCSRVHGRHWKTGDSRGWGMCGFCKAQVFRSVGMLAAWWEGLAVALRRGCPTSPQWSRRKEQDTSRRDLVEGWGRESSSQKGGCGNRDCDIVRVETVFAAEFWTDFKWQKWEVRKLLHTLWPIRC